MANNKDLTIFFEKDKDYRRFVTTFVIGKFNRQLAVIDLIEEVEPFPKGFKMGQKIGDIETFPPDSDLVNLVHATISVPPEQLPVIIRSLQNLYDEHLRRNNRGGDVDGQPE